jgi:hypothetical protein
MNRRMVSHALLVWLVSAVSLTSVGLGGDKLVTQIDIRNATSSDEAKYFVVICARPASLELPEAKKLPVASPGHVWVLFAKDDPNAKVCMMDKSYGFWPDGKAGLLNVVPGKLVNELLDPAKSAEQIKMTHRVILRVTESQYESALKAAEKTASQDLMYQTLIQNCSHFSMVVLKALSLEVKYDAAEMPTTYLERVSETIGKKFGPAR